MRIWMVHPKEKLDVKWSNPAEEEFYSFIFVFASYFLITRFLRSIIKFHIINTQST